MNEATSSLTRAGCWYQNCVNVGLIAILMICFCFGASQQKSGENCGIFLEFLDEKNIYLGSLLALAVLLHEAVLRQDRERLEAVLKAWTAAVRYAANPGNEVCGFVMEDVSEHLAQFGRDVYEICGPHPPIEMAAKFGRHSDANRPLGTNRGQ